MTPSLHRYIIVLVLVAFVSVALSASLPELMARRAHSKRGAVLTSQDASESEDGGRFLLENNLWGQSSATSGFQSSQVTGTSGNTITWQTSYNWVGNVYEVKSFANLDLKVGIGKRLADITTIPTVWNWSYESASTDLSANVAYDMWLDNSSTATGASSTTTYEVMVWLSSRGGATPAGSVIGSAIVNGITWTVYKGVVKTWVIFTFLTPGETTSYNSDLKPFFAYLVANQGIPASQYLVQLQAGTEPFMGTATLKTAAYSVSVN